MWKQVKVRTYPDDEVVSITKYTTRNGNRKYHLPGGVIPPARFVDNVQNGPWHCLDLIVKHFMNNPTLTNNNAEAQPGAGSKPGTEEQPGAVSKPGTEAHPGADTEASDPLICILENQALRDWIRFVEVFPRNDDGRGHETFIQNRPDLYHVPFAEFFATNERGEYDRKLVDKLLGGISYDKSSLPEAETLPSVQFGIKKVPKGSVRDVDSRRFADGSAVVRATKRTIDVLAAPIKKARKVSKETEEKRLAAESKRVAAAAKKQQREAEQARRAAMTDAERNKERADKARATKERNRLLKVAAASVVVTSVDGSTT
jgi:hypothetical protein